MRHLICAVYDGAVEAFMNPFVVRAKGEAIRAFHQVVNEPGTDIGRSPADYTLFVLGEFEVSTGQLYAFEAKVNLGTALEWKDAAERPMKVVTNG